MTKIRGTEEHGLLQMTIWMIRPPLCFSVPLQMVICKEDGPPDDQHFCGRMGLKYVPDLLIVWRILNTKFQLTWSSLTCLYMSQRRSLLVFALWFQQQYFAVTCEKSSHCHLSESQVDIVHWTTYIFSIFEEQRGNVLSNERLSIRCVDYKTGDASNEQRRTGGFSIKVSDSSVAKPQNQKNLNIYPTGRNGDKTCHKGCG